MLLGGYVTLREGSMQRSPAVAHQFYPGDAASLTKSLDQLVPKTAAKDKKKAIAAISPHAGYIYSGAVAGETFARITVPEDIIILGPNHHGQGAAIALMAQGEWIMPLGSVPVNKSLASKIERHATNITEDELAHRYEHSLEVQVPFLQFLQENITLVPLVVSFISYAACEEAGRAIAAAIKEYDRPVLIVASTDMTHYESRESATKKDKTAIDRVSALDPEGLYQTVIGNRISMCGVMPTTIALVAAIELGATEAELVRYTDSGETSGDTQQVVGYAGFVIS